MLLTCPGRALGPRGAGTEVLLRVSGTGIDGGQMKSVLVSRMLILHPPVFAFLFFFFLFKSHVIGGSLGGSAV